MVCISAWVIGDGMPTHFPRTVLCHSSCLLI
ncbi:Uncharacterised protein [Vibrio cholerae]|nr:Uncharacterised protein [Vibrio cholerae]